LIPPYVGSNPATPANSASVGACPVPASPKVPEGPRGWHFFSAGVTDSRAIALSVLPESSTDTQLPPEDAQALVASLVQSHGDQLRRFLLARVRNSGDVPDLLQEIYLRMLRVPSAESIRSPEAYLFTVAQHALQQYAMRRSAAPPLVEFSQLLSPPLAAADADPVLEVDAQQCLETLQAALDDLSPKMQATFLLHRRDGLSFGEIAARLGISEPMVRKYLMQALMRFRQRLHGAK
jgi:RNA polymerase sigma factor (sigma-70 family)